jgi:hypothetical protein
MTRRGSLAYYLAAWICGCFFMSVCVWARSMVSADSARGEYSIAGYSGFFFVVFCGLLYGAATALIGAFLLRRLMRALKWRSAVQWIVAGGVLAPALIWLVAELAHRTSASSVPAPTFVSVLIGGPKMVIAVGWWLAIPAGAATAYVLYRIDRAFAPGAQPIPVDTAEK